MEDRKTMSQRDRVNKEEGNLRRVKKASQGKNLGELEMKQEQKCRRTAPRSACVVGVCI